MSTFGLVAVVDPAVSPIGVAKGGMRGPRRLQQYPGKQFFRELLVFRPATEQLRLKTRVSSDECRYYWSQRSGQACGTRIGKGKKRSIVKLEGRLQAT